MPIILAFIKQYWLEIAVGVLVLGLVGAVKIQTARLHHSQQKNIELQASIDSFRVISEQLKAENDRIQQGSETATKITVQSYEKKLKARDNYYANHPNTVITELHDGGMLQQSSNHSSTPKTEVSGSPEGTDAATPDRILTEEDCTTTTIMLDSLQQWIINQEKVFNQEK